VFNPAIIKHSPLFLLLFILVLFLTSISCRTSRELGNDSASSLKQLWDSLGLDKTAHTGLEIYDLDKNKSIFSSRADNFFTPASNTKLLTMYAALRYLEENIPAAYYRFNGDTVMVWGGGDPGTLYKDIHGTSPFVEFLKSINKTIVFSNSLLKTERYGKGWVWDDYPYTFQCERTAFPIYGNRLWIDRYGDSLNLLPKYFSTLLSVKKDSIEKKGRNEWGNQYFYTYNLTQKESHATIPIAFFKNDMRFIWSEALHKDIFIKDVPLTGNVSTIIGSSRDTLLKGMMQESDNFVAEQLLLSCSMKQAGYMNEKSIIQKILDGPLASMPDSIIWVDGSGLSRYNLLTPRSMVWLMRQLIRQTSTDYIKVIFPAGGHSGTIKNNFGNSQTEPYLWAKSGTMRNVYCLTGFMVTNSGKTLVFSWMNNLFRENVSDLTESMDRLFYYLRSHY